MRRFRIKVKGSANKSCFMTTQTPMTSNGEESFTSQHAPET